MSSFAGGGCCMLSRELTTRRTLRTKPFSKCYQIESLNSIQYAVRTLRLLFYPPSFMRPSRDVFNCVHKFLWDNRLEYAVPSLLHVRAYMKVGYNLGGWVGFYFGRWCFRDWLYETTRDQLYIQAIRNAIDDNSLVLVLLLQSECYLSQMVVAVLQTSGC